MNQMTIARQYGELDGAVLSMQEAQQRINRIARESARTDATTTTLSDPEKNQARRVARGGRTVILPPEGYGDVWNGGAR